MVCDKLKPHHHVKLDPEFKFDCLIWEIFLTNYRNQAVCRPMVDLLKVNSASELMFYSDASANPRLGFGAIFGKNWLFAQWSNGFVEQNWPSIEYLELYALSAAVLTWSHLLENQRIVLFCDNTAMVGMVNSMTSSCKNCMYLLRLITLNNLIHNRRIYAKYISTMDNYLSDALSRLQFTRFWKLAPRGTNKVSSEISPLIWPVTHIWIK